MNALLREFLIDKALWFAYGSFRAKKRAQILQRAKELMAEGKCYF